MNGLRSGFPKRLQLRDRPPVVQDRGSPAKTAWPRQRRWNGSTLPEIRARHPNRTTHPLGSTLHDMPAVPSVALRLRATPSHQGQG